VETYLEGQEVSVMAFTDGKTVKVMLPSQDHKRVGDGDTGPNTGGMGAYSPVNFIDEATLKMIKEHILEPTIAGLEKEGRNYKGVLYAGLIMTPAGPKVMEFNCRFGDPETQAVLPLLNSDLADIFIAIVDGNLSIIDELDWNSGAAACVVLASRGYPEKVETGKRIFGLRNYSDMNCYLFHSGTRRDGKNWITAGGRVVGLTAVDHDLPSALARAYDVIDNIKFDGMIFRTDIGSKATSRMKSYGI
jgi:phosphoribosylamine--glycine ligase